MNFKNKKIDIVLISALLILYYVVPFLIDKITVIFNLDSFAYYLVIYLLIIPLTIIFLSFIYSKLTKSTLKNIIYVFICGLLLPLTAEISIIVTLCYLLIMGLLSLIFGLFGKYIKIKHP